MLSMVRVTNIKKTFWEYSKALENWKTYKILLDETAWPFSIATPRRLPLPLKQKVQEELKHLEKENIIRLMKMPTDWCAPIVAFFKNNDKFRFCVDQTQWRSKKRNTSTTFCRPIISWTILCPSIRQTGL